MSTESEVVVCSRPKSRSDYKAQEQEFHKESIFSYSRGFLLSLADIDICKRLPSGFDSSILREINDASTNTSLSQFYSDSDSSKSDGNLSQHSRTNHAKGLLGSGALQKKPGFFAGVPTEKVQDHHHLLNKSVAPYRPPHLSKMNLHSGRVNEDLYNDKTVGSSECPSLEKAEEERRRRESFELMRKKQNAIQEKQKNISHKQKENLDPDISKFLEDSRNNKMLLIKCNQSEECLISSTPYSTRHSSCMQTSAFRELLPHALMSRSHEKSFETKSLNHSHMSMHCEADQTKSSILCFSNIIHQSIEEAGGISMGEPDKYMASNRKANERESTRFSYGQYKVPHNLMASNSPSAVDEISTKLCSCDKSAVPPRVLACEEIEKSVQSEVSEHCLPEHHCLQSYDMEEAQPNSVSHPDASQHPLAPLKKSTYKTDLTVAPLKLNFSDTVNIVDLERNLNNKLRYGTGFSKELHSTELLVSQKHFPVRVAEYDLLGHARFPFLLDNDLNASTVDESIVINPESVTSGCAKPSCLNKMEDNQLVSNDVDIKIGLGYPRKQELMLNPVSGSEEKENASDEICWPDEDSLITFDDFTFPMDSLSITDRNATEADLFASRTEVNVSLKLPALNVNIDKRSRPRLGDRTFPVRSHDVIGSEASCGTARQSYPQFHHSQTNRGVELFHPLATQKAPWSSNVKFLDSKNYSYNPHTSSGVPVNVFPVRFRDLYAESKRYDNPVMHPLLEQMPIPCEFPHQLNGLRSGAPSHHPINKMAWFSHGLNQMQNFPLNHRQQMFGGFEMPNPDHNLGGNSNQAALVSRLLEMEKTAKQMRAAWSWSGNV